MFRVVGICSLTALFMAGDVRAEKLSPDERIELIRGLSAEYATAKVLIPRSKKTLTYPSTGSFNQTEWEEAAKTMGPAARKGDLIQVTKVDIDDKKIVLELNHGAKSGRKWYDHLEVGMGGSGQTRPVSQGPNDQTLAPAGTVVALDFGQQIPSPLTSADVKKMLKPILDFERTTATQSAFESLPPEVQVAVKEKRAIEGMDRDQVLLALGKPRQKTRETKDGDDFEDWIYGVPPGKITFVTFQGAKVVRVKDAYAGLGGQTAAPLPPR